MQSKLFKKTTLYLFYAFAFCVPLDLFPEALGLSNEFTPARIAGFLLFLFWLLERIFTPMRLSRMSLVCLLLLFYSALSLLWTRDWQHGFVYLITLLQLALMYQVILDVVDTMPKAWKALLAAGLGSALVVFAALYSALVLQMPRTMFFGAVNPDDTFVPNKVAGCMAFGLAVSASLIGHYKSKLVMFLALSYLAFTALAIVLTGSRGGMITVALGICVSFAASLLGAGKRSLRIPAIILIMALLLPAIINILPQDSIDRWLREDTQTYGGRPFVWSLLLNSWKSRPLFGFGLGGASDYQSLSPEIGIINSMVVNDLMPINKIAPHNILVSALVNGGIVSFLIWALFLFRPLWWLIRLRHLRRGNYFDRTTYDALLVSYAMIAMAAMMENVEYSKFVWITLALIEAIGLISCRDIKANLVFRAPKKHVRTRHMLASNDIVPDTGIARLNVQP